ncbi:hypothetical protein GGP85_000696 [Salinibacter ruber]|nr:S8/S53 family peptidase [Salinibacter ruber]MCS3626800.1 hypothetical protein [Salinibacter ruber]MCS3825265.1 hypothetical protein [Salinibacter ruber]MCS4034223.1 hypothetical protein [Salinibacter ruber]MCS4143947.1 hypothetical protein [Salinibacter ruber]
MHASFARLLAIFTLILAFLLPGRAAAQNQTNDPLVNQQQYLFDVHNIDQAWNYTTGSSNVTIGLYSMLGFTQNHEDLSSSRLKSPVGSLLKPKLDVASQMVGIVGANTNNGVGMTGIDRAAQLQSYSALRSTPECPQDCDEEEAVTVDRPNGTTETYYLNLYQFSDIVEQGRTNGVDVHLFSFGLPSPFPPDYDIPEPQDSIPVNLPRLPNTPWDAVKQVVVPAAKRANSNALCGNPFGDRLPLTWLLGDCTSRPNPYQQFSETVSSAVAKDGAAVVGPAGDLDADGDLPTRFTPGLRDRYAVTVGGVEFNNQFDLVKWSNTRPAPYVDVAGFAKNVVGVSGAGSSQYDTDFTSTAASASIGAGVAGLLKAEMPALTGEDIEEILRRTARDAGPPGEDEATGTGAIDADAALSYVRNNDVQRSRQSVKSVISKKKIRSGVDLRGNRYWNFTTVGFQNCPVAQGDLYEFKARVPYSQTFSSTPDVWVRWGKSNGYNSRIGQVSFFNPLIEGVQVVDVDERELTIRGHYWEADFFDSWGRRCAKDQRIPKLPKNFNIAYTAVGTEGPPPPPPLEASISGPGALNSGQQGTWAASVEGGSGSTSYDWEYREPGVYTWNDLGCTGKSCSHTFYNFGDIIKHGGVRVTVTKGSETDAASLIVGVTPSCGDNVLICPSGPGPLSANTTESSDETTSSAKTNNSSVDFLALRSLQVESTKSRATLTWTTTGQVPPSRFVVQQRPDTALSWSSLSSVNAADSVKTDSTHKPAYQVTVDSMSSSEDAGANPQFRLAYQHPDVPKRFTEILSVQPNGVSTLADTDASVVKSPNRARKTYNLQANRTNEEVILTWNGGKRSVPTTFAVQHRTDPAEEWSKIGTVTASDSVQTNGEPGPVYRFEAGGLAVGTHQFRLAHAGSQKVEGRRAKRKTKTSRVVSVTIELDGAYQLSTYPNPVRERVTVKLAVKERQDVQVRLYDVLGRRVATLHSGPLPAQELRRLRLDVSSTGLTSGTYFLRASGEDFDTTEQITVVR